MGLNVVVCVKPVPDPKYYGQVSLDPRTRTLVRRGIPTIINPSDRNAIEAALALRDRVGGTVVSVSMAPPDTVDTLREGLAMGVDEAYLLSDRLFAGSDTLATATALATAIRRIGRFDVVLMGSESADGGTGHLPSQIGEILQVPHLTSVRMIEWLGGGNLLIRQAFEHGFTEFEVGFPAVLGVTRHANTPRYATIMGVASSQGKKVHVWDAGEVGADLRSVGLAGSPTQAGELRVLTMNRKGHILEGKLETVVERLLEIMHSAGVSGH